MLQRLTLNSHSYPEPSSSWLAPSTLARGSHNLLPKACTFAIQRKSMRMSTCSNVLCPDLGLMRATRGFVGSIQGDSLYLLGWQKCGLWERDWYICYSRVRLPDYLVERYIVQTIVKCCHWLIVWYHNRSKIRQMPPTSTTTHQTMKYHPMTTRAGIRTSNVWIIVDCTTITPFNRHAHIVFLLR